MRRNGLMVFLIAVLPAAAQAGYSGILELRTVTVGDLPKSGLATDQMGLLVEKLSTGGPAEKAGLAVGDILIEADGNPLGNGGAFFRKISMEKKGRDGIRLAYLRGGVSSVVTVVLETRGQPPLILKKATPWRVDQWHNLPEGKTSLDVADFKGKILCLYFFQNG